jgi:putative oxidoreductase
MFRGLIATSSTWATIPIRLALAVIFVAHGAQKVLGSFGGPGFSGFTSGTTPFSFMRPPWLWLGAAALSELVGGVLVGLGLLTRFAAFLLTCTMLTAVVGVHWPIFFNNNHGMEYPLALLAMSLALLISGGGMASVDLALSSGRQRIGKGKR